MPVGWEYRESVLALRFVGVYANEDVERAVDEALADPRFADGTTLLVDGRRSETPISSTDIAWRIRFFCSLPARGLAPRIAFIIREEQKALAELARGALERPTISAVRFNVLTDEAEALAWLRA